MKHIIQYDNRYHHHHHCPCRTALSSWFSSPCWQCPPPLNRKCHDRQFFGQSVGSRHLFLWIFMSLIWRKYGICFGQHPWDFLSIYGVKWDQHPYPHWHKQSSRRPKGQSLDAWLFCDVGWTWKTPTIGCKMAIDAEDDRHWEMQERRLFGANHVVAGINFSKYDNIEVPVAIVPLKKGDPSIAMIRHVLYRFT